MRPPSPQGLRRMLFPAAVLLIMLLAAALLPAQDYDLRTSVTYGFDGVGKAARWTPIVLRLSNLGDAIHGEVVLTTWQGARTAEVRDPYVLRRELHLAKGAGEVLRFVVPVGAPTLPVDIRISAEDRVIYEEEIDAASRITPEALIVSLSTDRVLEALLSDSTPRDGRLRLRAQGPLSVAYPLPEFLPEEWHGYHGADLVFMSSAPLERLSREQWRSLRDWVRFGGQVVMTPPARGEPGRERRAELRDAASPAGLPAELFETRRLGAGAVHVLREDPAAPRVRDALRELALAQAAEGPRASLPTLMNRQAFAQPLIQTVLDGEIHNYPSRWLIALALMAYLASLAVLIRWIQRGSWQSIPTLLTLCLAVAAGFYLVLSVAGPAPRHALAEIQQLQLEEGDEIASLDRDVLILATEESSFRLRPPAGSALIPREGSRSVRYLRDEGSLIPTELPRWRNAHYYLAERLRSPLIAEQQGDINEGRVSLQNRTAYLIEELFVLFPERAYRLGSVSPGQEAKRSYRAEQALSPGELPDQYRQIVSMRQRSLGPLGVAARDEGLILALADRLAETSEIEPDVDVRYSFAVAEIRFRPGAEDE